MSMFTYAKSFRQLYHVKAIVIFAIAIDFHAFGSSYKHLKVTG